MKITPSITGIAIIDGSHLHCTFADGTEGVVDIGKYIGKNPGPVFKPLKDETFFRKGAYLHKLRTIAWPNGADIAPETLYKDIADACH